MGYLISHIAISLVFAQLLGLLLGWLLWGYVARQRAKEILTLRERIADMQMMTARLVSAAAPELPMPEPASLVSPSLQFLTAELPARSVARAAFIEDDGQELEVRPFVPATLQQVAPDLEAEVVQSRLQHLQDQVRTLEGFRDRLPLLQADLSDAIAGRKAAEAKFEEAKNDADVRFSGLLLQIREFENAAAGWDSQREQFEHERMDQEREVAAVKATLRDLQNSQRPQSVDYPLPAPSASAIELADLRERYQRAIREREAVATELEFWKQSSNGHSSDSGRVTELENAIRGRDSQLAEQAVRVESLLWHVAELEPFAAEAPQKDERLRRQESEIAGHIAMHSENGERIRSLQNHIAELESTTIPATELERMLAEHQAEVQQTAQQHQQRLAELQHSLSMKDDEISEHVSVRYEQMSVVDSLQAQIDSLEVSVQQMQALRKTVTDQDTEIRGLVAAHHDMQQEMEAWKARATEWEPAALKLPELQATCAEQAATLLQLRESHSDKEGQLTFLQERLSVMSGRMTAHQQRLSELELLAARVPDMEQTLQDREQQSQQRLQLLEERHQGDLTRLKVNSAQRLRRLRQSITGFKA